MPHIVMRIGCFETNSSSAHNIVLDINYTGIIDLGGISEEELNKGVLSIDPIEFGGDYEEFNDIKSKLAYIFESYMYGVPEIKEHINWDNDNLLELGITEEFVNAAFKRYEPMKWIYGNMKEWTGLDVWFRLKYEEYYPFGNINHVQKQIFKNTVTTPNELKNYLFSPNSKLITDSDNRDGYWERNDR